MRWIGVGGATIAPDDVNATRFLGFDFAGLYLREDMEEQRQKIPCSAKREEG